MASSTKAAAASGKRLKAASASAEDRAVKVVEEVAASKAWELLQEKLQEGGEALVNKLLNFCQCGAAEPATLQDSTPYRRNLCNLGNLNMKELKFLWESFHGSAWAEHICRTVRLPSGRSLLCWAVQGEPKDLVPGKTVGDLRDICLKQYQQRQL
jgi:hypothetical protein